MHAKNESRLRTWQQARLCLLGGEMVPVPEFPHFAVGGAVVGSVADLRLAQGVFGSLSIDEYGEVGPFVRPVVKTR